MRRRRPAAAGDDRRRRGHGAEGGGGDGQAGASASRPRPAGRARRDRSCRGQDADARLLTKTGQTVAGYNVQIAVDEKHKLIVASEVVNDGNDTGQLYAMARAAKQALGVERLQAVADVGYYNGETLRACEADAIVAYVPEADRNQRLAAQGRFTAEAFVYDAADDVYRCPAGAELRRMKGYARSGRQIACSLCQPRVGHCRACPLPPALSLRQGAATRRVSLGASGCNRAAPRADGAGGRHHAPPGSPGRASLRRRSNAAPDTATSCCAASTRCAANGA